MILLTLPNSLKHDEKRLALEVACTDQNCLSARPFNGTFSDVADSRRCARRRGALRSSFRVQPKRPSGRAENSLEVVLIDDRHRKTTVFRREADDMNSGASHHGDCPGWMIFTGCLATL
jgi:hypothetical protein